MNNQNLHLVYFQSLTEIPDINYGGYTSSGIIGEPTGFYDINDEMICVGDIVKTTQIDGDWFTNLVIKYQLSNDLIYYTVSGMVSKPLKDIIVKRKVERVIKYNCFTEKFRRHLFYIALPEEYLDTNWDFINGVWAKIK